MSREFDYQGFYDRIAPLYELGQELIPVWRRYTEAVLPWLPPDGSVLEVGPGPGLLLEKLSRRHPFAVGLDLSWGMLRQAQERLRRAGLPAHLVQGDVTRLPFQEGAFQGIATTFAFSAVPDGRTAMQEMARVLAPGGILALVDAGIPRDGNPGGVFLAHLWERFGDFLRDEAALMEEAGLQVIQRREFGVFNHIHLAVGRKPSPTSQSA